MNISKRTAFISACLAGFCGLSVSSLSICMADSVVQDSIQSRFQFDDQPVEVKTVVHPQQDILAIRVKSPMVRKGRCNPKIEFP